MLFGGMYYSLLDEGTDIEQLTRNLYPGLPCRHSFWKAQFLSCRVKRGHNANCRKLFDACIEDYKRYMELFWEGFQLSENNQPNEESKKYAARLLAIGKAINTIIDNKIRNPVQWLKWRHRERGLRGGRRMGRMIARRTSS